MNIKRNVPLIVAPYSSIIPGGIGTWIKNLMDYSGSGNGTPSYNVLVYTNHLKNITDTRMAARIVTGLVLYSKLFFLVFNALRKYRPSVLHLTSSASISLFKDQMLIMLSRLMKIPVIMHWHFGKIPLLAERQNWEWKMLGRVIRESRYSIVLDSQSYDILAKAGFSNLISVPNPIGKAIEKISQRAGNEENHRIKGRIIFVGHVIRDKGIFELVEACSQVLAVKELLLVGPFEEHTKLDLFNISSRRENGQWLKFTGILPEEQVLQLMQNSSILVLPSYAEGFPYVVLEAMAMKCPVIATGVGAIPEILAINTGSPCGVCIPVKNVERLRDSIQDLCLDSQKAETMGKNGSDRVLKNYTIEKVVEQYKFVWDKVSGSDRKSVS